MNKTAVLLCGLLAASAAWAGDEGAGKKAAEGGKAAAHGVEKGMEAAGRGFKKGAAATGRGLEKAGKWVQKKVDGKSRDK